MERLFQQQHPITGRGPIADHILSARFIQETRYMRAWSTMAGIYAGSIIIMGITMAMYIFGFPGTVFVGIEFSFVCL